MTLITIHNVHNSGINFTWAYDPKLDGPLENYQNDTTYNISYT